MCFHPSFSPSFLLNYVVFRSIVNSILKGATVIMYLILTFESFRHVCVITCTYDYYPYQCYKAEELVCLIFDYWFELKKYIMLDSSWKARKLFNIMLPPTDSCFSRYIRSSSAGYAMIYWSWYEVISVCQLLLKYSSMQYLVQCIRAWISNGLSHIIISYYGILGQDNDVACFPFITLYSGCEC